jgi:hypothetical protein
MKLTIIFLALALLIGGAGAVKLNAATQIDWSEWAGGPINITFDTNNIGGKLSGVTNGTAAQDAVTYSQLPYSTGTDILIVSYDASRGKAVSLWANNTLYESGANVTVINSAIAKMHSKKLGGTVKLQSMFYGITSSIQSYSNVCLVGESQAGSGLSGTASPMITYPEKITNEVTVGHVLVANMRIEAYGASNDAISMWATSATGAYKYYYLGFRDLELLTTGTGNLMVFYGLQNIEISGCTFRSAYNGVGILANGNSTAGTQGLFVSNSEFVGLMHGINTASSNRVLTAGFYISHCWFIDGSDSGNALRIVGVNDFNLVDSSIDQYKNPVLIDNCYVVRVSDNYIGDKSTTAKRCAINLASSAGQNSQVMIDANWFVNYNTGRYGIEVPVGNYGQAERLYIRDNEFVGLTTAINYSSPAHSGYSNIGTVGGNTFVVCTTGIYAEGMANTLVSGNNFVTCDTAMNSDHVSSIKVDGNLGLADA